MAENVITNTPQASNPEKAVVDQGIHLSNEIQPNFPGLDEEVIRKWFDAQTKYLQNKGATVTGPTTSEHAWQAGQLKEVKVVTKKDFADEGTAPVWECFYQWVYKDENPVTIRSVNVTELDALRDAAQQAMARRWE